MKRECSAGNKRVYHSAAARGIQQFAAACCRRSNRSLPWVWKGGGFTCSTWRVLLADILEKDLVSSELWTKALAGWYARLHAQTAPGDSNALLKTDNNLRNFIFREGLFYGLDFELLSPGDPARDLGQICAFILADRPSFTPGKLAAASGLIRHYRCLNKLPVSRIREELIRELERMAERRREESSSIKSFLGSCQGKINLFS